MVKDRFALFVFLKTRAEGVNEFAPIGFPLPLHFGRNDVANSIIVPFFWRAAIFCSDSLVGDTRCMFPNGFKLFVCIKAYIFLAGKSLFWLGFPNHNAIVAVKRECNTRNQILSSERRYWSVRGGGGGCGRRGRDISLILRNRRTAFVFFGLFAIGKLGSD